ncbi:helix-turn-helix family protein, partial [Vibrio cholerae CP1044(17)]
MMSTHPSLWLPNR